MLEDLTPPARIFPCAVRTLREQLSDSDQAILDAALANQTLWPNNMLARELSKRGLTISDKPIRKHRSGVCSCGLGLDNA